MAYLPWFIKILAYHMSGLPDWHEGADGMDIGLPKLATILAYSNFWMAAMLMQQSVQMGAQQMGGNARGGWQCNIDVGS